MVKTSLKDDKGKDKTCTGYTISFPIVNKEIYSKMKQNKNINNPVYKFLFKNSKFPILKTVKYCAAISTGDTNGTLSNF